MRVGQTMTEELLRSRPSENLRRLSIIERNFDPGSELGDKSVELLSKSKNPRRAHDLVRYGAKL